MPVICLVNPKMSVCRDNHRRLLAEKFELRRNLYKALCKDTSLPDDLREESRYKLSKLHTNQEPLHLLYETFRMSRLVFRALANKGMLNGVKKASW